MNIIYISSVCAQTRFDRLVSEGKINTQFQNQKFHHLILKGLRDVITGDINVVSYYPINRTSNIKNRFEEETEEGIKYIYPQYVNRPIIHHISKFFGTYHHIQKLFEQDSVIVCNMMNFDECLAALSFRLFHKVKVCSITADVPGVTSGAGKSEGALWKRIIIKIVSPLYRSANNKYDGYMFLTEDMNSVVNTKHNPYIVVEGLADTSMAEVENTLANKYEKKTILYAGGLHREYGIELLVNAFKKLDNPNVELHIYGKGNFEKQLVEEAKNDSRIKFGGTKSNAEIVQEQLKAHLLVNPRPTHEEFVKYSFPSKIMECMASGTPLLTTCIPSMPADYYPYVYCFDDESVDGYHKTLSQIIKLPKEELHNKGKNAKEFILNNKSYRIQSQKLSKLLLSLSNPVS